MKENSMQSGAKN